MASRTRYVLPYFDSNQRTSYVEPSRSVMRLSTISPEPPCRLDRISYLATGYFGACCAA